MFCVCIFPHFFPTMDNLSVLLLCLEQGNRSLKEHVEDFLFLAHLTNYPDNCLCSCWPEHHHQGAVFWGGTSRELHLRGVDTGILWIISDHWTSWSADDDTRATPNPVPSQRQHAVKGNNKSPPQTKSPSPLRCLSPHQEERSSGISPRSLS